jgi:hypothetical protein
MDQHSRSCIVCGNERDEGISIWNAFICNTCEQEMVHTEVMDEKYSFFVERMRNIWKMEA